jgi:hypothetical protein
VFHVFPLRKYFYIKPLSQVLTGQKNPFYCFSLLDALAAKVFVRSFATSCKNDKAIVDRGVTNTPDLCPIADQAP